MKRLMLTIAFCGGFLSGVQAAGLLGYEGWWVVLGSFADPDLTYDNNDEVQILRDNARRCNFNAFNDFSRKFVGFAPGYHVVVVGAYSRENSKSALRRIRPCIPGAYVKYGRYLGE
jgi:hypothetical protein